MVFRFTQKIAQIERERDRSEKREWEWIDEVEKVEDWYELLEVNRQKKREVTKEESEETRYTRADYY